MANNSLPAVLMVYIELERVRLGATQRQLSDQLERPLSTIGYALGQLERAELAYPTPRQRGQRGQRGGRAAIWRLRAAQP